MVSVYFIENGLSPTILNDPVVFDGYLSKNQLITEVKKGQAFFLECAKENVEEKAQTLSSTNPTNASESTLTTQNKNQKVTNNQSALFSSTSEQQ